MPVAHFAVNPQPKKLFKSVWPSDSSQQMKGQTDAPISG
jgi:hypothetical protein|tara:strand:- start:828 stop:944 length:117 start_codon:yes stop_codon:yes gene_type:complete